MILGFMLRLGLLPSNVLLFSYTMLNRFMWEEIHFFMLVNDFYGAKLDFFRFFVTMLAW